MTRVDARSKLPAMRVFQEPFDAIPGICRVFFLPTLITLILSMVHSVVLDEFGCEGWAGIEGTLHHGDARVQGN